MSEIEHRLPKRSRLIRLAACACAQALLLTLAALGAAQDGPKRPISGGVLNGKAVSKPQPAYPSVAKATRASGTVAVQVTVDEQGRVISASAVSGHPLLRGAAEAAARQAEFAPTRLGGKAVKVSGILTYDFKVGTEAGGEAGGAGGEPRAARDDDKAQERKFQIGDMVETGGGITAKILRCRGTGDNEECEVQYYRGDALESTPRWENASFLRQAEERTLNYKRQEAAAAQAENRDPAKPEAARPADAEDPTAEGCSFDAPAVNTSNTAKASEQLFKRKIFDIYAIGANGTGFAALKVGTTFLAFQMGKPFSNVVRVDKGFGAYRINDAAPPNATIYPVTSKHVVCEQYRDRTLRRQVENKYACFKNRDGEWLCGADGVPKIKQLN